MIDVFSVDFKLVDFANFIQSFSQCFDFIFQSLHDFFSVIENNLIYVIPLFSFLILGVVYWILWLILEVAPSAGGSSFGNPYKVFANPNRSIETKLPLWSGIGSKLLRNHDREKQRKAFEDQRAQEAYEKIVEEQAALENKRKLHAANQAKADEYFANNPNRTKVSIDGMEFFNGSDWYKKHYGRSAAYRHFDSPTEPDDPNVSIEVEDD